MTAEQLIDAFDQRVFMEEGRASVALTMMKYLPALSAEDAAAVYEHVVTARMHLVDEDSTGPHRDARLFTEGLLCGLRLRALIDH